MDDDVFFYIVSQVHTTFMLENVGDERDAPLALNRKTNDDRQLWKWKSNGLLANKSRNMYVLDVKTSSIKRRKTVIATIEKDDVNQGWYILDDHIICCRNNLALGTNSSREIVIEKQALNASQKWFLVPHKLWEQFQNTYNNTIPYNKVHFWVEVMKNYTHAMIGCTIAEYRQRVQDCKIAVNDCARTLHFVAPRTGTARVCGGAAAIVGGVLSFTGLGLAPFTAGASLGLTISGIMLGFSGGVTSSTSQIIDEVLNSKKNKVMKRAIMPVLCATLCLQNLCDIVIASCRNTDTSVEQRSAAKVAFTRVFIGGSTTSTVCYGGLGGKTVYTVARRMKSLKSLSKISGTLSDMRLGLAVDAAAPGLKIGGKTFIASGSTPAKGISGSFAAVGMAFGAWDVFSGAVQIKKKSKMANAFLKATEDMMNDTDSLLDIYKQIVESN